MKKIINLVKSLEKNEKRYFKRYVGLYSENKVDRDFMVLYNIIENHSEGGKETMKEKIAKAEFKYPSATGSYLYNIILTALTDYHRKLSPEVELLNNQIQYFILKKKGLYSNMNSLIKQMNKKVEKIESITYELIQLRNNFRFEISQSLHARKDTLYDEYHHAIVEKCQILEKQAQINLFSSEVTKKIKSGYIYSQEETQHILTTNSFLSDSLENQHPNVVACVNFTKMKLFYNQDPIDWENFHKTTMEHFDFVIIKRPEKVSLFNKIAAVYNAIYSSHLTDNFEDLEYLIKLLKAEKLSENFELDVQQLLLKIAYIYSEMQQPMSSDPELFVKNILSGMIVPVDGQVSIPFYEFGFKCVLISYCIDNNLFIPANELLIDVDSYNCNKLNIKDRIRFNILKMIYTFHEGNPKLQTSNTRGFKYLIEKDESLDPIIFEVYQFFMKLSNAHPNDHSLHFQVIQNKLKKYDPRKLKKMNLMSFQKWVKAIVESKNLV